MTGLRRGELANLKVGDLNLEGDAPFLIVRGGKGHKDRVVNLNSYIRDRLAAFTKGKKPEESVFGLAPKSITMKIWQWARKSGVPQYPHLQLSPTGRCFASPSRSYILCPRALQS